MKNLIFLFITILFIGSAHAQTTPISGLPSGGSIQVGDLIPATRSGITYGITASLYSSSIPGLVPMTSGLDSTHFLSASGAWLVPAGTGSGVSSINSVTGAFTFSGSGVSCTSTTCTFSGGTQTYPPSGIPNSTGSAWGGTSYATSGTGTTLALTASPTFTGAVTLPAGQIVNGVTLTTGGSSTAFLNGSGSYVAPFALTTTGSSGAATFSAGTLNIPQYSGGSMVYPGSGIPNSTGSAWGTSYGTSGTGSVALTTSPVFTTPNIGTATGNITGNAATVTTNANLTGPITSSGNTTSIAAQTGTGSTFVMSAAPTVTGVATFTGLHKITLNATSLPSAQTGTVIQAANADTIPTRVEADSFGATDYFSSIRTDGTNASKTALVTGDEIGGVNSWGYNGSTISGPQASLRSYAAANWTTGSNGTYVDVATTPIGTSTMSEVIRFENDGGVTLPSTVTGGDKGAGTINAAGIYVNGVAIGSSGSVSVTAATPDIVISPSPGTNTFTVGSVAVYNAAQTTNTTYALATTDNTKCVLYNNSSNGLWTIPQATTTGYGSGYATCIINQSSGNTLKLTPATSTINGVSSITLPACTSGLCPWAYIYSDGSNYQGGVSGGSGGSSGISIGTTTISGGTNAYFLYDNSGVVGNLPGVTVSGDVSIGTTGIATVTQIEGVATGTPTGTGNAVFSTSPTITTPTLTDPIESGNMTSSATLTATSNTTLAAITGLTYNATTGAVYNFHIHLTGVSNASGGIKIAFAGTAGASSFTSTCWNWNGSTINAVTLQTTYSSSLTAQTAAYTDIVCDGSTSVSTGGTFILEAAQNASFATSTTVLTGSSMTFQRSL